MEDRSRPPVEARPETTEPRGAVTAGVGRAGLRGRLFAVPMRYPNAYAWLVLVSAMDVMLTWRILEKGGTEVNPIARRIMEGWHLPGAIAFKFSLMIFVIIVCEAAGHARDRLGRALAYVAVVVSALAVAYSLALLVDHYLLRPVA